MPYNGPACKNHGVITICANHSLNSKPQTEPQQRKQLHHKVLEEFKILSARHTLQTEMIQLLKEYGRQLCVPIHALARTTPSSLKDTKYKAMNR